MRTEVEAGGSTLTVGELRAALAPLSDDVPIYAGSLTVDGVVAEDLRVDLLAEYEDGSDW